MSLLHVLFTRFHVFLEKPERQMVSETCLCLLSRQALRDGNKLAQMEEAPLFPGESIKAIGEFDLEYL